MERGKNRHSEKPNKFKCLLFCKSQEVGCCWWFFLFFFFEINLGKKYHKDHTLLEN